MFSLVLQTEFCHEINSIDALLVHAWEKGLTIFVNYTCFYYDMYTFWMHNGLLIHVVVDIQLIVPGNEILFHKHSKFDYLVLLDVRVYKPKNSLQVERNSHVIKTPQDQDILHALAIVA